jgi:ribonuclease HII
MDLYQYDSSLRKKGVHVMAGLDEAGRGPIAGPVVAAAVVLPDGLRIDGLRDSKKIPEKERTFLFWEVLSFSADVGVGVVEHDVIDRINILQATKLAMQIALSDLLCRPDLLIIDALTLPSIEIRQHSPVKAESKSASVAAASIIAKYVRDAIMLRYDGVYPQYNFKRHKGYCTKEHLEAIRIHGPCKIHRKSFNKVMSVFLPFDGYNL